MANAQNVVYFDVPEGNGVKSKALVPATKGPTCNAYVPLDLLQVEQFASQDNAIENFHQQHEKNAAALVLEMLHQEQSNELNDTYEEQKFEFLPFLQEDMDANLDQPSYFVPPDQGDTQLIATNDLDGYVMYDTLIFADQVEQVQQQQNDQVAAIMMQNDEMQKKMKDMLETQSTMHVGLLLDALHRYHISCNAIAMINEKVEQGRNDPTCRKMNYFELDKPWDTLNHYRYTFDTYYHSQDLFGAKIAKLLKIIEPTDVPLIDGLLPWENIEAMLYVASFNLKFLNEQSGCDAAGVSTTLQEWKEAVQVLKQTHNQLLDSTGLSKATIGRISIPDATIAICRTLDKMQSGAKYATFKQIGRHVDSMYETKFDAAQVQKLVHTKANTIKFLQSLHLYNIACNSIESIIFKSLEGQQSYPNKSVKQFRLKLDKLDKMETLEYMSLVHGEKLFGKKVETVLNKIEPIWAGEPADSLELPSWQSVEELYSLISLDTLNKAVDLNLKGSEWKEVMSKVKETYIDLTRDYEINEKIASKLMDSRVSQAIGENLDHIHKLKRHASFKKICACVSQLS